MKFIRRYKLAAKIKYRRDPEHKNKPEGTWYETEKGWSTAKPQSKNKEEESTVIETPISPKELEVLSQVQEEATKSIEDYYGSVEDEEREKIEEEYASKIVDYIQKVAKGETADLPELSDDEKVRFIQSLFIALKAKQIASIPAATEALESQRNDVVRKLLEHASNGLSSIVESLGVKSLTTKNIKSADVSDIYKKKISDKEPKEMNEEEFSEHLLSEGKRDFRHQFIKKPVMRGLDFEDLSLEDKEKASQLAEAASVYSQNFGKFNPNLQKSIKIKKGSSNVGFVMGDYKENDEAYYSDVSLPIDSMSFDKIPQTMNALLKTLASSGFKGRVEISTEASNIALNKNNIRIVTDDPKHLVGANEIVKESFLDNGVNVKTQIVKKQFGMTEDEQFDYVSKLKMLAREAGPKGKITFPESDIQKYFIAARLSGYDLIPEQNNTYTLRSHNPKSAIGKIKLHAKNEPDEAVKALKEAYSREITKQKEEEKLEDIPIEDPFVNIRNVQQELQNKNDFVENEIDFNDSGFDNDRQESVMKRRRRKKQKAVEEPQEVITDVEKKEEIPTISIKDNLNTYVSSIDEKVKAKDKTVLSDFDTMLSQMAEVIEGSDNFILKQFQKALNMSAASLLKGGYLSNLSPETGKKMEDVNKAIKEAMSVPAPKTQDQFDFSKLNHSEDFQLDEEQKSSLKKNPIIGNDGYNSGWLKNGTNIYSSDMKHKIEFGSDSEAESFAKKNPYLNNDEHLEVDVLDKYEQDLSQDKIDVSFKPDTTRLSSFMEKYNVKEDSPVARELLGYKRFLLQNISNEDRIKIREIGLSNFLSQQPVKQLQNDFVSKMNKENYEGEDYVEGQKTISSIDPQDFVKMISLISKSKTASTRRASGFNVTNIVNKILIFGNS